MNLNLFQERILKRASEENPLHFKKIRKNLKRLHADPDYEKLAAEFYGTYSDFLKGSGKTMDYAITSYLKMVDDMVAESARFHETGKYSSTSFEEVNQRVYSNPDAMEYYMHGLLLSQFIWVHHYDVLRYFNRQLPLLCGEAKTYLEVGAGHGLYLKTALRTMNADFSVVDISPTSIELTKNFCDDERVTYHVNSITDFTPQIKFDCIVMGEVLEHLEQPFAALQHLRSLLSENGILYITTPTNAPAIDHIYLFRNPDEIRQMIDESGFEIISENCFCSEDIPLEMAEELKVSVLYAAFMKRK